MPTLEWIGKKAVVTHHTEVPFHLLKDETALSCGDPGSGNLLVEGDNLLALKALLPYYAGQVKCIYIDPPYNTGKENWIYNDNVNSPEIKAWLGKVVGDEAEDLSRHDKWLCMMYPRLLLAKQFLSDDGVLFVSIDDTELPKLRLLLDELFPHPQAKNRLACFIWQTEGNFDNQAKIKNCHEYILAYSRKFEKFPPPPVIDPTIPKDSKLYKPEIRNTIVKNGPKNPISEIILPKGFPAAFKEGIVKARNNKWPHFEQDLIVVDYKLQKEVSVLSGWSSKEICLEFIGNHFLPVKDTKGQLTTFELKNTGAIECIKKRITEQSHVISVIRGVGSTQQASQQLSEMGIKFDYPKPVGLISYLISMMRDNSSTIMDFFAGSGTTGQAVLQLNKHDGGNRRFILVEMDSNICRNVTALRLHKICNGYAKDDNKKTEGFSYGFRFCSLGEPCFNEQGRINPKVTFAELARHVFFAATGEPMPAHKKANSPLLGVCNGTAVYLLYNGILNDKRPQGGNVLTQAVLESLPPHDGPKIIFGTANRLSPARLKSLGIIFKQIPYEIKIK
ncbi:MAG: site-specific DNA-methyltransferase [Deltaproteobacteria bacterium]|nr:site-specific DNA-methyltransferase [Deltaproteobacteria bacterium]